MNLRSGLRLLARVLLATLLAVVLAELGLRAAGWVYLQIHARDGAAGGTEPVLCVGDSHTFGIFLTKQDSYPSRLESILSRQMAAPAPAVENRGVPGMTSLDVLQELGETLKTRSYRAVLICVGANDRWKGVDETGWAASFGRLRLVKLARLLNAHFSQQTAVRSDVDRRIGVDEISGSPVVGATSRASLVIRDRSGKIVQFEQSTSGEKESDAELRAKLRRNVDSIVALCRNNKTKPVLVGYANEEGDHGVANGVLAEAATGNGVPFVDLRPAMEVASKTHRFEELYFPDRHPTRTACELVARVIFNRLLSDQVLEGKPVADVQADLPRSTALPSEIRVTGSIAAGNVALVVKTDPGRKFYIFLSHGAEPPTDVLGHRIPLLRDALFERTLAPEQPTLGVADSKGTCTIPISKLLKAEDRAGTKLYGVMALFGIGDRPGLNDIRDRTEIVLP